MIQDSTFFPKLEQLRDCVCATILAHDLPEPCFCGIIAGAAVIEDFVGYCHSCMSKQGMVWIRLDSVTPTPVVFSTAAQGAYSPCGVTLEAVVEIGTLRPAPAIDSRGNLPNEAEQLRAARLSYADMAAIIEAATCCFPSRQELRLIQWQALGPAGGVLGGALTVGILDA